MELVEAEEPWNDWVDWAARSAKGQDRVLILDVLGLVVHCPSLRFI